MNEVDLPLALLRGLHLVALLSAFGTLVFAALVAPPALHVRLMYQARIGALAALVLGLAWFIVQAAMFAGSWDVAAAIPATLLHTRFGHILGSRLVLIAALPVLSTFPKTGRWLAPIAAAIALASQGMISHAGAAEGNAAFGMIAAEALHLLAAGAWLGALLPLLLCLATLPPQGARLAAARFSPIGMAAVMIIAATAFAQSVALIGDFPGLIGTAYGLAALVKLGLFLLMLAFAVWNRLSLSARLDSTDSIRVARLLFVSIMTETGCGLLVVLTAGLLASLVPGIHQAPVWPFGWRPNLASMDDPDLRREVALAMLTTGSAVAGIALAWILRRYRLTALLLGGSAIAWQAPSFGLLVVEAYPTSYLTSRTGFTTASIARGQAVYAAQCVACHGFTGQGDGPAAAGLRPKPADLTAAHFWDHPDGALFWWIGQGMRGPGGDETMPALAAALPEDDRWAVIDFVRALNAGAALQLSGSWSHEVPAPDLPLVCEGEHADRLSDLRGRFVRIVTTPVATPAPDGIVIIRLDHIVGETPPPHGCTSATGSAWVAYAAVAGVAADTLAGSEFLIDPAGWLRVAHGPRAGPDWNDPVVLSAALQSLRDQPISGGLGGIHVHGR